MVLVATQGQGDEAALEAALRSGAGTVLMIASRRKAERLREIMRERGIDEARLARLQAPAGPDAGAKTPGEIALVAIVGVLALLRGRAGAAPAAVGGVARAAGGSLRPRRRPRPATGAQGRFVNPVCGMAVSIADAVHVERHEGVSYYFCCDGCWVAVSQGARQVRGDPRRRAGRGRGVSAVPVAVGGPRSAAIGEARRAGVG